VVEYSPGDTGKMQETPNRRGLSLFLGKHTSKATRWITKIQFQRGRLPREFTIPPNSTLGLMSGSWPQNPRTKVQKEQKLNIIVLSKYKSQS
jgi:hypothetical protein